MATFLELYNEIEYNIGKIRLVLTKTKHENEILKEENSTLKTENAKLQSDLSELKEKYRLLTITKTLEDKKDKTDTKRKINEMVREIDNCIRLLNK